MRYEKPIVMDLKARLVAGQVDPLSCYSGDMPGGFNVCGVGTGGDGWAGMCITGYGAAGDPFETLCFAGGTAQFCDAGAGGTEWGDDCTAGPSNV